MTGKCKHITLEGDEVQCRAGCDWSISGISGKDEIKVAERLLAYLIEDPTAQDYLYMQGDLGDKTKLPVNKGAIETLCIFSSLSLTGSIAIVSTPVEVLTPVVIWLSSSLTELDITSVIA